MALRFRKSIKLAPGIRWNISGSGSSFTLGPRGASIGIGKRGTFLNTGIPGLGLSSRANLLGGSTAQAKSTQQRLNHAGSVSVTCGVDESGLLTFTDANGMPMPEHVITAAKKQNRDALQGLIQKACDEVNANVEVLGRMHLDTPNPKIAPKFQVRPFDTAEPKPPTLKRPGFFDKFFKSRLLRIDAENHTATENYLSTLKDWQQHKAEFLTHMSARKFFVEELIYKDIPSMEQFLEESLQDITWPRETEIDFDISENGKEVCLDVNLPEIEDMPTKIAAVPSRGLKLSVKEMSTAKVQRLYSDHVHGVAFRLIGEVFAALPITQTVALSGYSQRRNNLTGELSNEYLISIRVDRSAWELLDFSGLSAIDVTESLTQFELKRDQLKSGAFKSIIPHAKSM